MTEIKTCQGCRNQFTIEPEDFQFYEKIKVPSPTWCPECRFQRRLIWRNERSLYRFKCGLCGKSGISMYSEDAPFPIYCVECWYSDKCCDPLEYGADYDFERPFFSQFSELLRRVPRPSIFHRSVTNAEYSNVVGESKNVYLSYSVTKNAEDVYYSKNIDGSRQIFDCLNMVGSERCYENVEGEKNYNSHFLFFSKDCMGSRLLYDCVNCRNCMLSVGLRNREYVIRNKQYSKEEYQRTLAELDFGSAEKMNDMIGEFADMCQRFPRRYARVVKSTGSTGDDLTNTKNARWCFDVYDSEDVKYTQRAFNIKGCCDGNNVANSELVYEFAGGGALSSARLLFSSHGLQNLQDVSYSDMCAFCSHIFGSVCMRSKQYCILNKQYSEKEWVEIVPKIIDQMNTMPYTDARGRVYTYGEFFPSELSLFAYNEAISQEYFPLTKDEAEKQGFRWKDPDTRAYAITKKPRDLPDHIKEVDDSVLKDTISCAHAGNCTHQCTTAFRIIPEELRFYRKEDIRLPHLCPNCRHYARLAQRNPLRLWRRNCQCAGAKSSNGVYTNTASHTHGATPCPSEFETPYAPERPEIVYCEQCYQAEVV